MRVIAGRHGGRRLQAPPGTNTRPTSDRVREALFSILGDHVEEANVLDLFAGSGALGIEALSRGARTVTFVDEAQQAIQTIRRNLERLNEDAQITRSDALKFLRRTQATPDPYDLVFLDPPYRLAERLGPELSVALPGVLAPGAIVIAESDQRAPIDLDLPLRDDRRYGDTRIRIHEP